MSKIITCPYCYKKFKNTDVEYQCENIERNFSGVEKCSQEVDRKFCDHWGIERESRHFFKGRPFSLFSSTPKPSKCNKCGEESTRFVCPHCHNWLPTEMIAEGSEIISIVGAPNSGKTVYFFNLMRQLEKKGYLLGLSVTAQDEGPDKEKKTSKIYRDMVRLMYTEHQLPPKTPVNEGEKPVPLIFKVSSKKVGKKAGRAIYIVFYDTPGEAFQDKEQIARMANHVSNSAGVLLFVDPYNLDELAGTLKAASNEDIVMGDSQENDRVLDSLLQQVDVKQSQDKPFAIVFSKIDEVLKGLQEKGESEALQHLDITENSSFLKTKKLSLSEISGIDEALGTLSGEWGIGGLQDKIRGKYNPDNIKMFAVSSLGSKPDGEYIENLNPYRVLDPLVWILHKMGGFDIPTEE